MELFKINIFYILLPLALWSGRTVDRYRYLFHTGVTLERVGSVPASRSRGLEEEHR
jgi:hypothetical protein